MNLLAGLAGFISLILIRSLAQGAVIWIMWAWFITTIWLVPTPGFLGCAGLALLANIVTLGQLPHPKNIGGWMYICLDEILLRSVAILALGFIYHFLMLGNI